ncbi:hypothetical protein NKH77_08240 [Streptomyces sp. M19]
MRAAGRFQDEFLAVVADLVGESHARHYGALLLTSAHGITDMELSGHLSTDRLRTTPTSWSTPSSAWSRTRVARRRADTLALRTREGSADPSSRFAAMSTEPRNDVAGTPDERELPSNWGRWGADDELGTLNLITDEARARAPRRPVPDGPSRWPSRSGPRRSSAGPSRPPPVTSHRSSS